MDAALLIARLILFGVFGVAGVAKLLDREGSREALEGFGLPKVAAIPGGFLLPIAEIIVAVLLLPRATAQYAAIGALLLLLAFIGGIAYNLSKGRTPDCHCFGQIHSEPAGTSTLIRNGVLSAVALFLLIGGWGDPGYSLVAWLGDLSGFEIALGIVSLFLLAAVAAEGWLLVHLLGQNGRVLLRLDQFEQSLSEAGAPAPAPAAPQPNPIKPPAAGLPVGTVAPAFKLEGLHGETSTLDSLRATRKPVMLLFSDPGCGPCNALLPDVGKWQREAGQQLTIAVITRGGAEKNKAKVAEHGLSHVLLQNDREVSNEYKAYGTPTAVIVSPDGKIETPVAGGADAIRALFAQATGAAPAPAPAAAAQPSNGSGAPAPAPAPRPQPQPQAAASRVGQAATSFALPDLTGKTVSLDDFKGKSTMLVFWNPGCGFCKNMANDLKAWEANPPANAPQLVYISTGTPEANAAMGLSSPMVLDQGFATGRTFGASGTPSAVLIDAEGKVASEVAVGAPSVLALANGEKPKPAPAGSGAPRPASLKIGSVAPAVKLNDADGNAVEIKGRSDNKSLLLFWSPTCGFCKRMVDDLKAWEEKKPATAPNVYLVSSGSAEENKALGLKSTILLDSSFATGRVFGASGTPSAVLIDEAGKVASDIVVGAPAVLELASTASGSAKAAK